MGMKTQHIQMYGAHTVTKYLTSDPRNCQDHQKPGKPESRSQFRGVLGDVMIKCYVSP